MKDKYIDNGLYEEIINFLLDQPMARKSVSEKELTMRCPFCGDSTKSQMSTNFYINIDKESDKFLCYKCFRASCNASGIVDQYFLERLGFSKYDCIRELNSYMIQKNKSNKNIRRYKSKIRKELSNVINTKTELSDRKLSYINHRMGLNLSYKDIYDLKINLDLNYLLKINNIEIPKNKTYYYNKLSGYGVSFISTYNDYVIIRDISKSNKLHKRYTNINIFDNYDNVTKSYSIPRKINLLSTEPTVLNITEGAFDIIGVYYHLDIDRNYENQIFAASSGSGIVNVILHYIREYGLIDLKINIFSDADVSIDMYKKLYKLKKYLYNFDITIYYNSIEKDFGVEKSKIKLIRSKL